MLVKNPGYWDVANVKLKGIRVLQVNSANTAINLYEKGQINLILDKSMIPTDLLETLRGRNDFHPFKFLGVYYYRFNVTRKPFDDVRVRKAIAMAIDKERILKKIVRGPEPVALSYTPPGTGGYDPYVGPVYNVAKARQLLAEAGYPDGKGIPEIKILFNTSELHRPIAVEVQSILKENLNINVSLENREWKIYLSQMSSLEYDMVRSSWIGDYNDPNTFLDMYVTGGGNNRTGFSNTEYDALVEKAALSQDRQERFKIFRQIEKILVEDEVPIVPIYHYAGVQLYNAQKIGGVFPNLLDVHPYKDIYLKN